MDNATTPGSRPRKGLAAVLAVLTGAAVITVAGLAASPDRAEAAGLSAFTSCAELSAWGDAALEANSGFARAEGDFSADGSVATSMSPTVAANEVGAERADSASAGTSAGAAQEQADATNVVVEGVDELDVIDRLGGDVVLVVAGPNLAIVDLGAAEVLATLGVANGAQVTYDDQAGVAWVVGQSDDGTQVTVRRVAVGGDSLEAAGSWETTGYLVDARRVGDRLHLVASDSFSGPTGTRPPFPGGPVPCDQVLHPTGQSDPSATLIVTLPATGALDPINATEVVGSGQLVHVTTEAAYLATPQWDGERPTTSVHRFELGDLTHTGSGAVPGTLLNDFSMSDHDGYLRVAITDGAGMGFGGPVMIDDFSDPGAGGDLPVGTDGSTGSAGAMEVAPPESSVPETTMPDTTVPETTIPGEPLPSTVPETTVPETTTTVPATTTTEATTTTTTTTEATTTTTVVTGITIPGRGADDPLNKVVVLDTEGPLDVVGSTPWFGHPDERLEGIRFDGDQAYAVTFLQTDPFYVLDLSVPTDPKIAGEVELPGFSSYLHPVADGLVVGFGPDGNGQQAAKLFDVSNPAAPAVVDTIVIGDDSPVAYDHHAFVSLGDGRFAVPTTSYSTLVATTCPEPMPIEPGIGDSGIVEGDMGPCQGGEPASAVVELEVQDGRLREVSRASAVLGNYETAQRVIPVGEGWALVGFTRIALVDADGTLLDTVEIS